MRIGQMMRKALSGDATREAATLNTWRSGGVVKRKKKLTLMT